MHHLAILISTILCRHALGEWWIGSDVWRNLSTYGPLEAMGALSRWRQCPLHDFMLGQRHEVILNTMIRRFSIHDEIKRPEYFPCTNMSLTLRCPYLYLLLCVCVSVYMCATNASPWRP